MARRPYFTMWSMVMLVGLTLIGCAGEEALAPPPAPGHGMIQVATAPDSLQVAWTLTGPDSYSLAGSGDLSLPDMALGSYTLIWDPVPGWTSPVNATRALADDDTVTFNGTYEEILGTGTIHIDPTPDALDATWTLFGPDLHTSTSGHGDQTLPDMTIGEYFLVWGPVVDWTSPTNISRTLVLDGEVTFSGTYYLTHGFGTIVVTPFPAALDAPWTLLGPDNSTTLGQGGQTLANMPSGDYSILWGTVPAWVRPADSTVTLYAGVTVTFDGLYLEGVGSLEGFVMIPPNTEAMPGVFTMGSNEGPAETPHEVTLTGRFNMAETEVTSGQYVAALQWAYDRGHVTVDGASVRDALDGSTEELFRIQPNVCLIEYSGGVFFTRFPERPMALLTWFGAVAYCDWLSLQEGFTRAYDHTTWLCNGGDPYGADGVRLPTEAEWEFACRAGTITPFNTGGCLDPLTEANYNAHFPYRNCPIGIFSGRTLEVATFGPNDWALYDMHGNSTEWCNDWYGLYTGDDSDPVGPQTGTLRVMRGGLWNYDGFSCRSASRDYSNPDLVDEDRSGFRPVRSIN